MIGRVMCANRVASAMICPSKRILILVSVTFCLVEVKVSKI